MKKKRTEKDEMACCDYDRISNVTHAHIPEKNTRNQIRTVKIYRLKKSKSLLGIEVCLSRCG